MIRLNVRFIRGSTIFNAFGSACFQYFCVAPVISRRLPCSSWSEICCFEILCRKINVLCAPSEIDAIGPEGSSSGSSSLCQPIPSVPLAYKLSRHELKVNAVWRSSVCFTSDNCGVHGRAVFWILEYVYVTGLSACHETCRLVVITFPNMAISSCCQGTSCLMVEKYSLAWALFRKPEW